MKLRALIFILCLFGGATGGGAQTDRMPAPEAQDFCEVTTAPEQFQGQAITLEASAHVLYGGTLLESDRCKTQEVTLHFMHGYGKQSNVAGLETLNRLRAKVRNATLRGAGMKAERARASVVFEGRLEKNPYYHLQMARGDATLAAWDYNYQYAFVLTRIISVRPVE
jgi:hypothetical protein